MRSIFKVVILIIVLMCTHSVQAQKRRDVRDIIMSGNEYYFKDQYSKAMEFYYSAIALDSLNVYANFHIAECHRKIFNFIEAEHYYHVVAAEQKTDFPLAKFYYPLMQKLNGKFQQAIVNFDAFITYAKDKNFDDRQEFIKKAAIEKEGCYFAISHLENPFGEYNFENLGEPVNSAYNDYAPFIIDHDSAIIVTSGRSTVTGKTLNNRYGEYFSDNFRFEKDTIGWKLFGNEDNFQINNTTLAEGAGSYSPVQEAFYYTGCYEDDSFCKIYLSQKVKGQWQSPKELPSPINMKGTDNKQPSITSYGDTLFFVSNRPGGFGDNDIWMSVKGKDGKWREPINMGEKVNTPYNEVAPFYYEADDILFFSSDGHEGLGGLDIFMAKGGIGSFTHVENLGYPFNSNHDDGYLVLGENKGFLASNRQGGVGSFDIYQFNIITRQSIIADIDKTVQNEERMLQSRVLDRNGTEVYVMREEDQFFYDNLKSEEKAAVARIVAAKLEAFSTTGGLQLSTKDLAFYNGLTSIDQSRIDKMVLILYEGVDKDLDKYMKAIPVREPLYSYLTITGKLFVTNTDEPAPQIEIPLLDEEGNTVKVTTTNKDGTFKYINLPSNRKYRILSENTPKKLTESSKFYVKNIQLAEEVKKPLIISFEHVYFDIDKKELRPEAKKVLDELIDFYRANPHIQIELFAYTDFTGSDAYNMGLSEERGKAVLNYLIDKGVDRTALVVEAQGKDVATLSKNKQTNLQLNRRVEFNIVGATQSYISDIKTYITQQKVSLEQLSAFTGNTIEEIRTMNGAIADPVPAYTPIRLNNNNEHTQAEGILFLPLLR